MGRYTGQTCRLIFMLVLTAGFFVAELVSGSMGNSIALVSDSFNMLSDLIALSVGLGTGRMARRRGRPVSPTASFGHGRAEVVGALSNAVFLAALNFTILVEALQRLAGPEAISDAFLVLVVGALGLAVNIVGLLVFQEWPCCGGSSSPAASPPPPPGHPVDGQLHAAPGSAALDGAAAATGPLEQVEVEIQSTDVAGDSINTQKNLEEEVTEKKEKKSEALNIRGVLLHVMGDALGSVIVVVAASIFYVLPLEENEPCNWECYIDPSLTIVMVFIILSSAFPLIKETATILLQMVPKSVNMQILTNKLLDVPGVSSIHELHIWELVKGKNIATLHVKCHTNTDYQVASFKLREMFHEAGVHSVTIQPEFIDHKSPEILCSSPCVSKTCDAQLCCSQQEAFLARASYFPEPNGGLSPTLQKLFHRNDVVEIPIEPMWAEDVKKKNSSPKDSYKETGNTKPCKNSTHF
ncbi:Zinc transporter 10 [Varanus komodoensis]|uniref:zinc transporter 10 n=1 Tax=Varanus komodoensis TaxID=61221 RepID=UPI001CF7893F|nr:zinc transporter 10 [Varanus komodoensis]KAF7253213.1 Zinc transporter 10 [Varanus komodoensis]